MKVAVFSDIHANSVAFDAVLADIEREQVDQLVCLGDVAAPGPHPRAVLDRLYALDCPVVRGNVDDRVVNFFAGTSPPVPQISGSRRGTTLAEGYEIERWCTEQLVSDDAEWLQSLPLTIELSLGEGIRLLCCHGTPEDNTAFVRGALTYEQLEQVIGGYDATVLVAGHSHVQHIRRHKSTTFVNVGSVGSAEERDATGRWVRYAPWAEYGLIRWEAGRLGIELRRVPFDLEELSQAATISGMPYAAEWIMGWQAAG